MNPAFSIFMRVLSQVLIYVRVFSMISPKVITLSFLVVLSTVLPQNLQAAEMASKNTAVHKLQRGFVNIALSPV